MARTNGRVHGVYARYESYSKGYVLATRAMDVSVGPQILEHISKSVQITSYDVKWIPSSARFVVMGAFARATGCLQVCTSWTAST